MSWIDKEEDAESSLGDFGVRKYDDGTGRFISIDRLWESFRHLSPYHYAENNPLILKDPTGDSAGVSLSGMIVGGTLVTAGVLLADDVTVIGIVDDVAIPVVLVGGFALAGIAWLAENATTAPSTDLPTKPYAPSRPLPRDENGEVIPESEYPHTELGTRQSKSKPGQTYPQSREFGENGEHIKDIDWTDHGRPQNHTNPHEHPINPKTKARGAAQPVTTPCVVPVYNLPVGSRPSAD